MSKALPKSLLSSLDLTDQQIESTLELAFEMKKRYRSQTLPPTLDRKTLFLLLFSSSTRTRASFEAAMTALGGHTQIIDARSTRVSDGEAIKDVARVYSQFGHALAVRPASEYRGQVYGDGWRKLCEFAEHATIPTVSLGCDRFHPCQGLSDLMTVRERIPEPRGKTYVLLWSYSKFMRDPSSMQEEMLLMARAGMNITVCAPPGMSLDAEVVKHVKADCHKNGAAFVETADRREALSDAHIVFPRNWMTTNRAALSLAPNDTDGEQQQHKKYQSWKLTRDEFRLMNDSRMLMHVLPVFRNEEVDDDVADDPQSIIFEQTQNKLYLQMAVLHQMITGERSI